MALLVIEELAHFFAVVKLPRLGLPPGSNAHTVFASEVCTSDLHALHQ